MIFRALLLVVASAAFWLVTALPARSLWGDLAAVHAGAAVLLCLIPALLTFFWASWAMRSDPQQVPMAALGASGFRMMVVALVALLLYTQAPYFRNEMGFLIWVLVAYLFVLAVEVSLLVCGPQARQPNKAEDGGGSGPAGIA